MSCLCRLPHVASFELSRCSPHLMVSVWTLFALVMWRCGWHPSPTANWLSACSTDPLCHNRSVRALVSPPCLTVLHLVVCIVSAGVEWSALGLSEGTVATVEDVWEGKVLGQFSGKLPATPGPHAVLLYTLSLV